MVATRGFGLWVDSVEGVGVGREVGVEVDEDEITVQKLPRRLLIPRGGKK